MPKSQKRVIHNPTVGIYPHGEQGLRVQIRDALNPGKLSVTFVIDTWRWKQMRGQVAEIGRKANEAYLRRAQSVLEDTQ